MELPPINSRAAMPGHKQNAFMLSPTQRSPVRRSPSVEGMNLQPVAENRKQIFMSQRKTVDLGSPMMPGGGYVNVSPTRNRNLSPILQAARAEAAMANSAANATMDPGILGSIRARQRD